MSIDNQFQQCAFGANDFSNYLIAGNLCNAFAIGEVGSNDDFFLLGSEPDPGTDYPLLTGNILDSEGKLLFRLVRNLLVVNPSNCAKILGNHIGYEIHDGLGVPIIKVETTYTKLPGLEAEAYVTRLYGTFYDRSGTEVVTASAEGGELLGVKTKHIFGLNANGKGVYSAGYSDAEADVACAALIHRGKVFRLLTGRHRDEKLSLDGAIVKDAVLDNCEISLDSGNFIIVGENIFNGTHFFLGGEAKNIHDLIKSVQGS